MPRSDGSADTTSWPGRRRWRGPFRDAPTWQVAHLVDLVETDEPVLLTDLVLTEILQGLRTDTDIRRVERRLAAFDVLRLETLDDFRRAASLYRHALGAGYTIRGTLDCLTASVCVRETVELLHADRDFDHLAACTPLRVTLPGDSLNPRLRGADAGR